MSFKPLSGWINQHGIKVRSFAGACCVRFPRKCEDDMSRKKERGYFVCPRWDEVATSPHHTASPFPNGRARGSAKIIAAIENGQPVARSTLRRALLDVRQRSGKTFDVDAYIVDQRMASPGPR